METKRRTSQLQKVILVMAYAMELTEEQASTMYGFHFDPQAFTSRDVYWTYYNHFKTESVLPKLPGGPSSPFSSREYVVVSRSLKTLRERGLIIETGRGRRALYHLTSEGQRSVESLLLMTRHVSNKVRLKIVQDYLIQFRSSPAEISPERRVYLDRVAELDIKMRAMIHGR